MRKGQAKDIPLALHFIELLARIGSVHASPTATKVLARMFSECDEHGVWHPHNLRVSPKAGNKLSHHTYPLAGRGEEHRGTRGGRHLPSGADCPADRVGGGDGMKGRGFGFQVSGVGGSDPMDISAAGMPGLAPLPLHGSNDLAPGTRHPAPVTTTHLDLTPFGFTPTESLIYEVLLTGGPGTGYAIARTAGLARANAYAALEALVGKGAARSEEGKPKRYRPEPPTALLARIMDGHGAAMDTLSATLDEISVPASPTLVAVTNARGALQLISHETARAKESVHLLAPADAYPVLTPALRRAAGAGVSLSLRSVGPVSLPFAEVDALETRARLARAAGDPGGGRP